MSWKDNLSDDGKKEVEALETAIRERDQKLGNAGQELAENRRDKQTIEAERDALRIKLQEAEEKAKAGGTHQGGITEADVRKILGEKDSKVASDNKVLAEQRFKAEHKEFAEDADPGGVKFSAVKAKFARYNLDGLSTVEDFLSLWKDAYTVINPASAVDSGEDFNPYAASPSDTGHSPKETSKSALSPKEKKLLTRMGWTEEQYLKQKNKRPTYIKQLLDYME